MFLHPTIPYLLTKLGWQQKRHEEGPDRLLNPRSQGCPAGAERAARFLGAHARDGRTAAMAVRTRVRQFSL